MTAKLRLRLLLAAIAATLSLAAIITTSYLLLDYAGGQMIEMNNREGMR